MWFLLLFFLSYHSSASVYSTYSVITVYPVIATYPFIAICPVIVIYPASYQENRRSFLFCPASTVRQMVVDKPRSLQVGVTNRSTEEFEPSFFHILAHDIGFGRRRRNLTQ